MKIHIPTIQEKEKEKQEQEKNGMSENISDDLTQKYVTNSSGLASKETETTNNINTSNSSSQNTKVNINTATQTQLETLPGIGPSTAIKIIAYRQEKGKFKNIEDIKEVSGIGDSKFNKIKDYITVK